MNKLTVLLTTVALPIGGFILGFYVGRVYSGQRSSNTNNEKQLAEHSRLSSKLTASSKLSGNESRQLLSNSGIQLNKDRISLPKVDEDRQDAQLTNSDMVLTTQRTKRHTTQQKYNFIFEELSSLSPAEMMQLKSLLVARETAVGDAIVATSRQGVGRDSPTFHKAIDAARNDYNSSIATLLGSNASEFFELDQLSSPLEFINRSLSLDMAFANVPLTREQRMALARVMKEIHYSNSDPLYPALVNAPIDPATGLSPINQSLIERSTSFLSPEQIKVIRDLQEIQTAYQNLARTLRPQNRQ